MLILDFIYSSVELCTSAIRNMAEYVCGMAALHNCLWPGFDYLHVATESKGEFYQGRGQWTQLWAAKLGVYWLFKVATKRSSECS